MVITLTALNTRAEIQDFICHLDSVDACFDVVNSIVNRGNRLIRAVLIDQGTRTELPVEAFDGQPISSPLQELEKDWQLILQEGVNATATDGQLLTNLTDNRIKRHEANIIKFEQAVNLAQQRLQRIESCHLQGVYYAQTLNQLKRTLERCEQNLAAEQRGLRRLLDQL